MEEIEVNTMLDKDEGMQFLNDLEEEDRNAILLSDIEKYNIKKIEYTLYNGSKQHMLHIYTNCLHKIL